MEIRRLQVTTVAGLDFPHATQALRITRRVRSLHGQRWRTVTVYAVTNLTAAQASPARLADWIRGHWGIEALHHTRDTTFAEDASQVRTGNTHGPWPACATSPSASCTPAATTTSPPRCAVTPATPPGSCRCWASQADEPDTPALYRGPALPAGRAYGYPKTEPAYMNLSNTLVTARRAGRRLAGCGIGRMSPTPQVGTISR